MWSTVINSVFFFNLFYRFIVSKAILKPVGSFVSCLNKTLGAWTCPVQTPTTSTRRKCTCTHMCVKVRRCTVCLPQSLSILFFWYRISLSMEIIHQSRLAGKDPSVHLSLLPQPLALRSQICATDMPDSHENLARFRPSCLQRRHFPGWTISPNPFICFKNSY